MARGATANGTRRRPARGDSVQSLLRPGAQLFDPAQVAQIQRARILAAMFDVATQKGAANVSVAHVVERSGVSRRTFYEAFTDREDCFLAAFEDALAFASQRVLPAYEAERKWQERIRAGVVALLWFLDEEPVIGRLLVVESLVGGAKTLERRSEVLAQLTAATDEGRTPKGTLTGAQAVKHAKSASALPPLTAEGVVGGALSVIHTRLAQDDHEPLIELVNPLMSMIVLPYLGLAAARRELERSVEPPARERQDSALLSDPFKEAGMRLTYRTVRVLMAIAELGGRGTSPSNRLVADTAEIKDQGQVSKLLGRLERIGMVSNSGLGPGQGAPNAWTLTANGRQLANSIRTHTEDHKPGHSGR